MYLMLMRREHQFLTLSAEDRNLAFRREQPHVLGRVAQYEIAAYLGITPVSLSRLVAKLRREGIL